MPKKSSTTTQPAYRYLRGYAIDPGFSTRLDTAGINEVTYRIPYETVGPGPCGDYIEVIDVDPASNCWYEPVDLRDEAIATQHGLAPSEGNPQFHQQFVYAVAMKTIRHFERALGRKVVWNPRRILRKGQTPEDRSYFTREYVQRLRINPHAFRDANAYYDEAKRAVLFGYFVAAEETKGNNYPGGIVFTCLSPDIVAHEMTHAILDSIHPRYMEDTNPDVAAFHEGFADIVALLQRFTFTDLVEHQLFEAKGRLDRYSILGELATQFGEALRGNRGALRNMIGRWNKDRTKWEPLKPSPRDYARSTEEHDRGAVLVATIFDAFQRLYNHRTQDLLRIATDGTGVLPDGSIGRDLVHRLAVEACQIAEHMLHVCIRALDYCPPHDITFGDYLRAAITADLDIAPEDQRGTRLALMEAFRARGILPDRVTTFSEDSLRWTPPAFTQKQKDTFSWLARELKEDIRELVDASTREELYRRSERAKEHMWHLLNSERGVFTDAEFEVFLNHIGLTSRPVRDLFGRDSRNVRFLHRGKRDDSFRPPIEVHTMRPAYRPGQDGRPVEQVLITLTQSISIDISDPDEERPREMRFRGGCSLILSLGNLNVVEFAVQKHIKSYKRLLRQMQFMNGETDAAPASMSLYEDERRSARINFNLLHGALT